MDSWRGFNGRVEFGDGSCDGGSRVNDADEGAVLVVGEIQRDQQAAGLRIGGVALGFFVGDQGEIFGAGFFQRGDVEEV